MEQLCVAFWPNDCSGTFYLFTVKLFLNDHGHRLIIVFFPYFLSFVNSDPMRITKKFAGSSCTGKQVFIPRDGPIDDKELSEIQDNLKVLEKTFMSKIDRQQRIGFVMPPYMNQGMPSMGGFPMYHPHQMANHLHGLPVMHGLHHPSAPPGTTFPMGSNGFYGFPPSFMPPGSMGYIQNNQGGNNKGTSSSESSDSDPENSSARIALANETIRLSGSNVMSQHHANEAILRQDRHQMLHHPSLQSSHHPIGSSSTQSLPSSSSYSSSNGQGSGGVAPVYRSRQSYTSAELFGYQYPTTLEHMALLSSENLEAATSRKKRSSNGGNVSSGSSQLHVQVGQHNPHQKGSSSSKGKKGSTGRILPADPIDLDASSLLLNFFQSTTTVLEENKSDTSNETSNHEVTYAGSVENSKNQDENDGEGGDIQDEHKHKKCKIGRTSSMGTSADEKGQPPTATDIDNVLPDKQEAPSTSTSDGKLNDRCGKYKSSTSSGSGRTSNGSGTGSGDGENDDSASTFSDAADADASNSISGNRYELTLAMLITSPTSYQSTIRLIFVYLSTHPSFFSPSVPPSLIDSDPVCFRPIMFVVLFWRPS